jgi:hypothetical protein
MQRRNIAIKLMKASDDDDDDEKEEDADEV